MNLGLLKHVPWFACLIVLGLVGTIVLGYFDLWTGVFILPWWGYLLVTLGLTHVTIATVTIYLHRHLAHRALDLHPVVSHFFRFYKWLTTGMVDKEWTAAHRKHHVCCETPQDPHSPQIHGLHRVLWGGTFLYVAATRDQDMLKRYGKGTPDDWLERNIYAPHHKVGILLLYVGDIVCFGPIAGMLMWLVQMAWIPFWAAGVINGIGHYFGYRNSDTPDASHNIVPWGILIGGEELHNNHHAFQTSAKLSLRRFEFDIGWCYIRILEHLSLASVKMLPPIEQTSRCFVDAQTLAVLRKDKGRIRYLYRKLLLWVVAQELPHAEGEVRIHLEEVRRTLARPSWKDDAILAVCARLAALSGSTSRLPAVGKFAELLAHIQAPHTEVQITREREASLMAELNEWCRQMMRDRSPQIARFAQMLIATASVAH